MYILIAIVVVILGIYLIKQMNQSASQDHVSNNLDALEAAQSSVVDPDEPSSKDTPNKAIQEPPHKQHQTKKNTNKQKNNSKPPKPILQPVKNPPPKKIEQSFRKMAAIWRKPEDSETCYRCSGTLTTETIELASFKYGKIQGYVRTSAWACSVCKYVCANESNLIQIKKQASGCQFQINDWGITPKIMVPVTEPKKHDFQWPSTYAVETLKPGNKDGNRFGLESPLHKLGYKITDSNRSKRWIILENEALPKLGLEKVANVIATNVKARKRQKGGANKYSHAIFEWEYDLKKLKDTYYRRDFQWPTTD
ncbi:hypothetical protein [Paenibacillus andongensis]|uniref:hypothetical protein n=1 Tax=Paenibacillus andongensis TaxID=2975482 RepID=UPI0021BA89A3|nr:hypothetical protein [Paenibacillus andongensis]